jgi:hypothetical protein
LLERGSTIPQAINPQCITDHTVLILQPIDLKHLRVANLSLSHHHLRKERQDHSGGGSRCQSFIPRQLVLLALQMSPPLPLEPRIPQEANDGQQRQGRNPLRLLQPHRGDGRRVFDPPDPLLHRAMLLLRGVHNLRGRADLCRYSGGQDGPPVVRFRPFQGLCFSSEARADGFSTCLVFRRPSPPPALGGVNASTR